MIFRFCYGLLFKQLEWPGMNNLPTYTAPADGRLSAAMVADFKEAGVLILEGFISAEQCRKLREPTLGLIEKFDPAEYKHVFSAMEQTQLGDKLLTNGQSSEGSNRDH